MTEQEIRALVTPPTKCESQIQFDELMHAYNYEQSRLNHPYLDQLRELNSRKALLDAQREAIRVQLEAIKVERLDIEQKKKDINRVFHALKHELITLNPKGLKNDPKQPKE